MEVGGEAEVTLLEEFKASMPDVAFLLFCVHSVATKSSLMICFQ